MFYFSGSNHQCLRRWRTKHTSLMGNQQPLRKQIHTWRSQGVHTGRPSEEDLCLLFIHGTRMPVYWYRRWTYLRPRLNFIWTQRSRYISGYSYAKVRGCLIFSLDIICVCTNWEYYKFFSVFIFCGIFSIFDSWIGLKCDDKSSWIF